MTRRRFKDRVCGLWRNEQKMQKTETDDVVRHKTHPGISASIKGRENKLLVSGSTIILGL